MGKVARVTSGIPKRGKKRKLNKDLASKDKVPYAKPGARPYERVEELVDFIKMAVAAGHSRPQIARLIINPETGAPISCDTLERHYARELEIGLDEANLRMSNSAFAQGLGFPGVLNQNFGQIDTRKNIYQDGQRFKNPRYGKIDTRKWEVPPVPPSPIMTIWWEKTRAGKKEGVVHEHVGADGQPLVQQTVIIVLPSNGRERGATPILDLQARRVPLQDHGGSK